MEQITQIYPLSLNMSWRSDDFNKRLNHINIWKIPKVKLQIKQMKNFSQSVNFLYSVWKEDLFWNLYLKTILYTCNLYNRYTQSRWQNFSVNLKKNDETLKRNSKYDSCKFNTTHLHSMSTRKQVNITCKCLILEAHIYRLQRRIKLRCDIKPWRHWPINTDLLRY